jgi:flagellin
MAITINTNTSAMVAQRNLSAASMKSAASLAKLSSGSRVPAAKDDAAAMAIGSRLNSEVVALRQAGLNAGQASSLLQIADGAMAQISDVVSRMQALAVQAKSGQLSSTERTILDTEFAQLQAEVDRIADDTKFNGTQLLAGATAVTSNVNDLNATASGEADNLLGEGFEDFIFTSSYGDGGVKVDYDGTTRAMTLTDILTGDKETVTVTSSTISAGDTEDVNFNNLGVTVRINSLFSKSTDIAPTDTATIDINANDIAITETITNGTLAISGDSITSVTGGDDSDPLKASDLDGVTITFGGGLDSTTDATATVAGATGNTSFSIKDGGSIDLSTTGTKTATFANGTGDEFVLSFDVDTTTDTNETVFTMALAADHTGAVEASSIELTDVDLGGTTTFLGDIDDATIAFDTSTASAAEGTITLNSVAFSSGNAGGSDVDLTSTGTKTLVMADANGNTISVQFNVTAAFDADDSLSIELKEMGQLVGAESATSSTAFDFQVGTGVTTAEDVISVTLNAVDATSLGIADGTIGIDGSDGTNAQAAITALETAVTTLNTARATVGAGQNRLDFASANIAVALENNAAAKSSLMDVDVSQEMTEFTSKQVLIQAGVSMLAQANQQPALLLRLLQ